MILFLRTKLLSTIFSLIAAIGFAQELSSVQALKLVEKNASSIGISSDDLKNVIVTNAYKDNISGMELIYLQQSFQGLPVYNTLQVIAIKEETVESVTGSRIDKLANKVNVAKTVPSINAKRAVGLAAKFLSIPLDFQIENTLTILKSSPDNQKVTFGMSPISKEEITSDLMWVPLEDGSVKLAWQVKILPLNTPDYWLVFVSTQDGSILETANLNVSCTFDDGEGHRMAENMSSINTAVNVFESSVSSKITTDQKFDDVNTSNYRVIAFPAESMRHPNGIPVLVSSPWLNAGVGNAAITSGWHNDGVVDYSSTRGNNVWAKEDRAGNNSTMGLSANSTSPAPDLNFDFAFNSALQPYDGSNHDFGVTNLFYWNNIMHNITYQYGFDEISGNFQATNFGRGGLGNDYVFADAYDGSGTNNANFATPPDGNRPRMQMFLWDSPPKSLYINSPSSAAGFVASQEGGVSPNNKLASVGPVTGNLVLYKDAPAGIDNFACNVPQNAAEISGKIVLIERGNCGFIDKIKNAQQAGAKGVIVFDNVTTNVLLLMGGEDVSITIPAIAVLKSTGDALKSLMSSQTVNVTLLASTMKIDGGLDNGIIAHEYAHGISSRLTGGPSTVTCLQNREQMGEGWSDFYALMITTDWATVTINDGNRLRSIGSYILDANPASGIGIRGYPYTTDMTKNPLTYARLSAIATDKARPHEVGEIWAATLWDMVWNFIAIDGINPNLYNANGKGGNSDALKLVTFAMKIQPCSPGFIDGRDALLKADEILFNGKYACAIWQSFARRGMGINAKQGDTNITTDQETSYAVPSGARLRKSVDKAISDQNDILTYTFTVKAQCSSINNYNIVDTLAGNITWVSGGVYEPTNRTVSFSVPSLAANQSQTFTFKAKVNQGTYFASSTLFSETFQNSYVSATFVTNPILDNTWVSSTVANSAPYSVKSTGTSTASEQTLTSQNSYPISGHVTFSFWNNYDTEVSRDGGVVEITTDNGATWIDAGPYMIQNGYNSTILSSSSLNNMRAFSGKSNGFVQTIINLSSFKGKSIKFRFRYVADNSIGSTGWYIDDVLLKREAAVYNLASLYSSTSLLQNHADTVTFITANILPLIWGDFTVTKDGNLATINWSTLQEINTEKFLVERSLDGINFSSIGTVGASGNSNSKVNYKMIDPSPVTGVNYYRIGQVDRDGRISYSDIRSLVFDGNNRAITIAPNPAKDKIVVHLAGNKDVVQIDLLNTTGQKLATYQVKQEKNSIDLPVLAPGVYYIRVAGKMNTGIKKLMIE
ncbi:MAG: M36 family metallopeptidase [Ginsengibacter sp.]